MSITQPVPIIAKSASHVVDLCQQILTASVEDRTLSSDLRVGIQNIQVRLKIWAGNVGVFAPTTASLAYRLRDDPDLMALLLSILTKLKHDLDMAADPPLIEEIEDVDKSGGREGRPDSVASSSTSALLSLDSSAEESSPSGEIAAPNAPAVFIKEANSMVDRLYRLASVFRKPVSYSENAKVQNMIQKLKDGKDDAELEDVKDQALSHMKAHFPQTPKILVERLVESVVFRRMKIRYRERHQSKLNQGLGLPFATQSLGKDHSKFTSSEARPTSGLSSRLEGHYQAKGKSRMPPRVAASATIASSIDRQRLAAGGYARSTAPSVITQAAVGRRRQLDVPSPPKPLNAEQTKLECPYCRRLLQLEEFKEPRWTRHILKDIDPYVCLFENCKESHTLFKTPGEWIGHMQWQHDVVYACQAVGHEHNVFPSAEDLGAHILQDHPGAFNESQLPSLIKRSALPASNTFTNLNISYSVAESRCLLCKNFDGGEGANGADDAGPEQRMQSHILEHLEALALLALPGDDDSEGVISNIRHSSRDINTTSREEIDSLPLNSFEDTGARAPDDDSVPDDDTSGGSWAAVFGDSRHSKFPEPENDPVLISLQQKKGKNAAHGAATETRSEIGVRGSAANQLTEDASQMLGRTSSKDDVELELQIRKSLLPPSSREQFLPNNELDRIVTFDTVYTELVSVLGCENSQNDLKKISQQICNKVKRPESSSTSRRKIFATLVCINKAACILDFIHENLYDCHLPFNLRDPYPKEIYVYRKMKNNDAARVDCFSRKGWSIMDCENFVNN